MAAVAQQRHGAVKTRMRRAIQPWTMLKKPTWLIAPSNIDKFGLSMCVDHWSNSSSRGLYLCAYMNAAIWRTTNWAICQTQQHIRSGGNWVASFSRTQSVIEALPLCRLLIICVECGLFVFDEIIQPKWPILFSWIIC